MVAITVAIIRQLGAILKVLLSEADFFVDEKDLQTFVGAAFQPRFFFAPRVPGHDDPASCRWL
jgi:hypothetical protein